MTFCTECGSELKSMSWPDDAPRCPNTKCKQYDKTISKKDLADLCMWISEGLKVTGDGEINWRVIMKIAQDFASDNNLEIKLI